MRWWWSEKLYWGNFVSDWFLQCVCMWREMADGNTHTVYAQPKGHKEQGHRDKACVPTHTAVNYLSFRCICASVRHHPASSFLAVRFFFFWFSIFTCVSLAFCYYLCLSQSVYKNRHIKNIHIEIKCYQLSVMYCSELSQRWEWQMCVLLLGT